MSDLKAIISVAFDIGDSIPPTKAFVSHQGHLRCDANLTRCGVLKYKQHDGSWQNVLRHPDQVFNPDSLESIGGIPITVSHPMEDGNYVLVTPQNWSKYGQGTVGDEIENPKLSNPYVRVKGFNVQGIKALDALNKGNKQLSPGYQVVKVPEDGVFDNIRYTHRQYGLNIHDPSKGIIKYNHAAIMDVGEVGRSGDNVKVFIGDSSDESLDSLNLVYPENQILFDRNEETVRKIFDLGSNSNKGKRKMGNRLIELLNVTTDSAGKIRVGTREWLAVDDAGMVSLPGDQFGQIMSMLQQLIMMQKEDLANESEPDQDDSMPVTPEDKTAMESVKPQGLDSIKAVVDGYLKLKGENEALKASPTVDTASDAFVNAVKAKCALMVDSIPYASNITVDMKDRDIHLAVIKKWNPAFIIADSMPDATVEGIYLTAIDSLKKINRRSAPVTTTVDAADPDVDKVVVDATEEINKNMKVSRNTGRQFFANKGKGKSA